MKSGKILKGIAFAAICLILTGRAAALPIVPVYISDFHQGSFYFLADSLDWNSEYHLLLFDYHSDATAVCNSNFIREKLREHRFTGDKTELYSYWKANGVIQSNNWIEPLMPAPVSRVTWVYPEKLNEEQRYNLKEESRHQINYTAALCPDRGFDLSGRFDVTDFHTLRKTPICGEPVVVSIDLDYFKNMNNAEAADAFEDIMSYISKIRHLKVITVAVSRPYLSSDSQADYLLSMALKRLFNTVNTRIYLEPFSSYGPDRSVLAIKKAENKKQPVYYDFRRADPTLRNLILRNYKLINVTESLDEWSRLLDEWRKDSPRIPGLQVNASEENAGCRFKVDASEKFTVEFNNEISESCELRWYMRGSAHERYNIFPVNAGFASGAPSLVYFPDFELEELINRRSISSDDLIGYFDSATGYGTIRLFARLICEDIIETEEIVISRYRDRTYTGYLTEIFNLPYVFGGIYLNVNGAASAEALYGTDCANFLIYGKRRQGIRIPYGDPGAMYKSLTMYAEVEGFTNSKAVSKTGLLNIDSSLIKAGIILHFGNHVAALYEDTPPYGILDKSDLVVHQLEGYPEIIPLGELKQSERKFRVMFFSEP